MERNKVIEALADVANRYGFGLRKTRRGIPRLQLGKQKHIRTTINGYPIPKSEYKNYEYEAETEISFTPTGIRKHWYGTWTSTLTTISQGNQRAGDPDFQVRWIQNHNWEKYL